jgi:hypothetical protein
MKRSHWFVLLMVCLISLPLAGTESAQVQPFDVKKCRQELEIMRGILRTTLGFASKELAASTKSSDADWNKGFSVFMRSGEFSNIGAFYLAGQGAVFTIPTSGLREALRVRKNLNLRNAFNLSPAGQPEGQPGIQPGVQPEIQPGVQWGTFEFDFDDLGGQLADQAEDLAELAVQGVLAPPEPPEPPEPPVPAVAASPPAPAPAAQAAPRAPAAVPGSESPSGKQERAHKELFDLQEKAKRRAEEDEASRARFRERLGQLKVFLIEALANHGDSMTVVKANEYLNLVITDDGRSFWVGDDPTSQRTQREIISVQKSVISDYKAGRLSLDGFKQKVMNYLN